ncbi:MAG: RNase P subunit p30 family protein [Candidatus Micrarchaeota archaeon]
MDYFDLHTRFTLQAPGEQGFSKILVWGKDLEEFKDNWDSGKPTLLDSSDPSYLKPRIKRCSIVYDPSFQLDLGVIRAAAKHEKPFEIPIARLLLNSGIERAMLMKRMRRFLKICNKLGAGYILTSRATNVYEMKRPPELIAIGGILGLTYDQALRAITETPKTVLRL